jgi:hypothetical protein
MNADFAPNRAGGKSAAPVTLEALADLIEWYADGPEERPGMSPPLALGWDIHSQFGADGFAIWRDLIFAYEPPLLATDLMPSDQRVAVTTEQYEAALVADWADFARGMDGWDTLIIDAMSRARHDGWLVAGDEETISATESVLDDLAKRSGAKRFAETTPDERHCARLEQYHAADRRAYEAWIAAGEPIGRAIKYNR